MRERDNYRILVCGSRDWHDQNMVWTVLDGLWTNYETGYLVAHMDTFTLIEGGARGADSHAADWARNAPTHSHNEKPEGPRFEHLQVPANWDQLGTRAGPLRNVQMLEEGDPTLVVAFTDDLTQSRGTRHMVDLAQRAKVPVWVCGHAPRRSHP